MGTEEMSHLYDNLGRRVVWADKPGEIVGVMVSPSYAVKLDSGRIVHVGVDKVEIQPRPCICKWDGPNANTGGLLEMVKWEPECPQHPRGRCVAGCDDAFPSTVDPWCTVHGFA